MSNTDLQYIHSALLLLKYAVHSACKTGRLIMLCIQKVSVRIATLP